MKRILCGLALLSVLASQALAGDDDKEEKIKTLIRRLNPDLSPPAP